eukprot:tig00000796_g4243.t1
MMRGDPDSVPPGGGGIPAGKVAASNPVLSAPAGPPGSKPLDPGVKKDLTKLFVTLVLYTFSLGAMLPNVPKVIKGFAGDDTSTASVYLGVVTATHALMEFLFNPILGELSDHYGRKWILVMAVGGSFVSALFLAFSPTFIILAIGHTVTGAVGITFGMSYAYITDVSEKEDVSKHFGLIGVAFGVGFVVGPGVGGLLGSVSPRYPFFLAAAFLALDVLWTALFIRETNPECDMKGKPFNWRAASPFHALGILNRTPMLRVGTAVIFLSGVAAGSYNVFVLYSEHRMGWGMKEVGAFLGLVGILSCISQGLAMPKLLPRLGDRRLLTYGLIGNILQFIVFAMAVHWAIAYSALAFSAVGFLIGPLVRSLMAKMVDEHEQGALQGAMGGVSTLTRVVGPLIATQSFGLVTREGVAASVPSGALLFAEGLPYWLAALFALVAYALETWAMHAYPPAVAEDAPNAFHSRSPPLLPIAGELPPIKPFTLSAEPVGGGGRRPLERDAEAGHVRGPDALAGYPDPDP